MRPISYSLARRLLLGFIALIVAAVAIGFFAANGTPVPSAAGLTGQLTRQETKPPTLPALPTPTESTGTRGAAPRPTKVEQAEELLARQAAAVKSRSRPAYLATIDPEADDDFAETAERTYANLTELEVADYTFGAPQEDVGGLTPERQLTLGVTAWVGEVDVTVTLEGGDPEPWTYSQRLAFVERDGKLYLAGDREGEASEEARPLWLEADINVVRGDRSLVFGTGPKSRLRPYALTADRAIPRVSEVWGKFWAQYVVVVVPADQAQMESIVGTEQGTQSTVAAVTTSVGRAHPELASHIVVNPGTFSDVGVLGRLVVMTHEITHVATHATVTAMPIWLSEGFADYVGFLDAGLSTSVVAQEFLRDVRDDGAPKTLPDGTQFAPDSDELDEAYEASWLACRYIVAHWNQQKLVEFYRAMDEARSDSTRVAAYRTVLDTTPAEFLAGWRAYVEDKAG